MLSRSKDDQVRTAKEQRFVELMLQGRSRRAAAIEAGFTENQAAHAYDIVKRVQVPLKEAIERAIPKDLIASTLVAGLTAETTKFFAHKGVVEDSRNVIAWSERREYAKLISQITGDLRQEEQNQNVTFVVSPIMSAGSSQVAACKPGDPMPPLPELPPQDVVVEASDNQSDDVSD